MFKNKFPLPDYLDKIDLSPEDDSETRSIQKACKFCGKNGLQWEDDNGKWILIDSKSGEIHKCSKLRGSRPPLIQMDDLIE